MPEPFGSFNWLGKLAKAGLIVVLSFLGLLVISGVARTVSSFATRQDAGVLIGGGLRVLGLLVAVLLSIVAYGLVITLLHIYAGIRTQNDRLSRSEALLEAVQIKLERLVELAPLSDQAKGLIFREREIEAVREIINECLARQDYAQAEQLIERMDKQFGVSTEAERFRVEVAASREATTEEKVNAAIARVDSIITQHNWARAMRESERLSQVFPDNQKVASLPKRIAEARSAHKRNLLSEYGDAVKRNEVDRSIHLLRELDMYLTPQEAAALQESARGVFRAKLHNLGIQFAIAVTDEQWAAALRTGEEIVREFPNTRMAGEVRQKLDTLRQRAAAAG